MSKTKRIPYGISDYGRMRRENGYYVDKTQYIPQIEAAPFYLFCLRPRRSGKSLWLSVLQHYYDINQTDNFDFLFGDTYIGQNPTPDRNSYLVLFLNFSMVNPQPDQVQASFEENTNNEIDDFLSRYAEFFTEAELSYIQGGNNVQARLQRIFYHAIRRQLKIYLFIDEYDNFTNTVLNAENVFHGFLLAYLNITHHFLTWSERETDGGFVDLYLEPFVARFPMIKYGYLIELKYISKKEYDGKGGKKEYDKKITDAETQLRQYADDPRISEVASQVTLKKLAIVYKGWELAHAEELTE